MQGSVPQAGRPDPRQATSPSSALSMATHCLPLPHAQMHAHTSTHTHTPHIHTHHTHTMYIHTPHPNMHMYTHLYVSTHACMYICVHVGSTFMWVHMYVLQGKEGGPGGVCGRRAEGGNSP